MDSEIAALEAMIDSAGYNGVAPQAVLRYVMGTRYNHQAQEWPVSDSKRGAQKPDVLTEKEEVDRPFLGMPVPNPTTGSVQLSYELPIESTGLVQLIDIHGRVLQSYKVVEGISQLDLDLSIFPKGIIFCTLKTEQWPAQSRAIVIQ